MNASFLLHTTAIGVGFILGLVVFLTNPKRHTNQFFFLLAVLLTCWMTCQAIGFTSQTLTRVATYIRICMMIAVFIPLAFDWLRVTITHPKLSGRSIFISSPFWFILCLGIAALSLTHIFVRGAVFPEGRTLLEPDYAPLFPLYVVYHISGLSILLYRYFRDVKHETGAKKTELQIVILGCATGLTVGIGITLILPLITGNSQFAMLTPLSVICLYLTIGYGIATRRIMDVASLLRRLSAYALLVIGLAGLYAGVWFLTEVILRGFGLSFGAPPHFAASLTVAFSLAPTHGLMKRLTDHLFIHYAIPDANQIIQAADSLFRSTKSLDRLLRDFSSLIITTFGTNAAVILIKQSTNYAQRYPAPVDDGFIIALNDPLPQAFTAAREPIVPDILRRLRLESSIEKACQTIDQKGFAAAIGLFSQGELEGIILLNPRLSGSIYGAPEQKVLQLLCNQLASAISSGRLYTQLQDSKIYNEILVDSLFSGVIAATHDGTITVFNREAQRITGRSSSETLAQPLNMLPHPLDTLLRETLDGGASTANQDYSLPQESGEPIPLRVSSSVIYGHAGKQLGAFLVINDLTAIRQLELQVRRTDRLASLGTLAAGMAHEIKNPLVSIKTFTQLMPERYDDADFRATFSSLVGGEVKRIDSIVNQLLRFSRPSKPVLAAISLHDLLNSALKLLQQQMRSKDIQLATSFTAAPDQINADGDQLSQAFINFFLNALESMQQGGTLTVTTTLPVPGHPAGAWWNGHPDRTMILIGIQDTGEGIPAADLSHIFDPFFTTKAQGTGLGLSVAHGIIHEHGGLIDVKSAPGYGTTFTIAIPLLQEGRQS